MPVQQVPYEIPDNIMIKILTGEYVIKNERICYAEGPQRGKPVIFSDDPKKNAKLFDNNVLSYIKKQRDRIGKELDKKLSKLIKGDKKEQSKIRHAFEEVAEKVKENQPKINEAGKKAADAIKSHGKQVMAAGAVIAEGAKKNTVKVKKAGKKMAKAAANNREKMVDGIKGLAEKAVENKNAILIGAAIAAGAAVAIAMIISITAEKAGAAYDYVVSNESTDKALKRFRKALRIYIDGVRHATMDIDKINLMDDAIDRLEDNNEFEQIKIILTSENLGELVDLLLGYTEQFAEINGVKRHWNENKRNGEALQDFKKYLKVQGRVFNEAA